MLDTGSSDLWVTSTACQSASCQSSKNLLYPTTSFSTSGLSVDLKYGDSSTGTHAAGPIGKDTVAIGDLHLDGQYFAAIEDTTTTVLETGSGGIFGVGFPVISQIFTDVYQSSQQKSFISQPLNNTSSTTLSVPPLPTLSTSTTSAAATTSASRSTSDSSPLTSAVADTARLLNNTRRKHLQNARRLVHNYATLFFPDFSHLTSGPNTGVKTRQASNETGSDSADASSNQTVPDNGPTGVSGVEDQNNAASGTSTVPQVLASFSDYGPFISRLVATSSLTKPLFAISLQRDVVDTSDDINLASASSVLGSITIGDLPEGVSSDSLTWADVRLYPTSQGGLPSPPNTNEQYPLAWEIPIDGVFLDGVRVPDSTLTPSGVAVTALIDSGSSMMRGPSDVLKYMENTLGSTFACNTAHNLTFQIGGQFFPVDPRDFGQQADTNSVDQCVLNLVATDTPVLGSGYLYSWSLGDPFLKG